MKGCSPRITEFDKLRYLAFQDIGCIACVIERRPQTPADVHHITQEDNQQTLPLCPWHHRGDPPQGLSQHLAEHVCGPSLKHTPRKFEERYGTEAALLVRVNRMVEEIFRREVGYVARA